MLAGNKASDCLRPPLVDGLSPQCKALKYTYGQCKRNLIDMRKRFRGPVPVAYRKNAEEEHQLYSGIEHGSGQKAEQSDSSQESNAGTARR